MQEARLQPPPALYLMGGGIWDGSNFGDNLFTCPEEIGVAGSFSIIGCRNIQLPHRLWVEWDFSLIDCPNTTTLPEELFVGGNLFIKDTPIGEIPTAAKIMGRVIRVPSTA